MTRFECVFVLCQRCLIEKETKKLAEFAQILMQEDSTTENVDVVKRKNSCIKFSCARCVTSEQPSTIGHFAMLRSVEKKWKMNDKSQITWIIVTSRRKYALNH